MLGEMTEMKVAKGSILILLITLIAAFNGPSDALSQPLRGGVSGEFREKFVQLRKLIEEKKSGGADVSKAMELGRQAREAEKSGDREKTTELIDEAMALLKEPETEPAEEPGDTTES
ncbi:MAG: hypothetical protein HYY56_03210, partial [Candidatus Omnitrophica bacterium]|nr:hypothetical protein [Candidatus Omnitrophota bacterium]